MNNVKSITPNAPADFTPSLGNYKDLQPFRYWCHKILPMVYDDSLSYYELLCKVVDYLNKTMEDVETLHGDITNIRTAYEELQGYVNDYFSTLDVQEEINNKLDNMASSGELYEIIRKYTDPIVNEQNDKINVLKARMDTFASLPDGSTTGDAELQDIRVGYDGTTYASAGDAVRGQVSELKSDLTSFAINHYFLPTIRYFDNSYITAGTGTLKESNGYKATAFIVVPNGTAKLLFYGNYSSADVYNAFYDENEIFIKSFTAYDYVNVPENAKYIRCSFTNDVFNTIYFKMVSITELYNLALNTIRFQGTIKLSDFDTSKNIDVIVSLNDAKNLGYYEGPNGDTIYFTATQSGTELSTYEYKFTVPRYNAVVLDIKDSSTHSGRAQIEIKTYEDIKSTDIVLFSNEYSEAITNIGGLMYEKLLLEKINTIKYRDKNNDTIMKSICRFGESYGQPESVQALLSCQKAGFNYMRVNLQFTRDNIPVLWHDLSLNQHNKNVYNGDILVPYSDENKITISETTFSLLNIYKYGSTSYNAGIPTLESILSVARKSGMCVYIEGKMAFTDEQLDKVLSLIRKYALDERVSISFPDHSNALYMANKNKKLRIGLQNSTFTNDVKETFASLKVITNNLYWWGYASMKLTNEIVSFLSDNNIEYECGDFTSYESIENYLSQEYSWYCTGVEIQGTISPLVGQYIFNNI